MTGDQRVLITGATGEIGSALALAYAREGCTLILLGRQRARLQEIADQCQARGATVQTQVMDVRERDALMAWAQALTLRMPLDVLIVNAGVNTNIGEHGEGELWRNAEEVVEVNLLAAMALVNAVLPSMRARGAGQIALISSLAAYFGLPVTPSYCASKAGIKAYGEALRGWLAPEGIKVNVVMPGYVASPMCDAMPGPKPLLCTPERAAFLIHRGLMRNKARISFPFPLNWGTWWLAVLPAAISGWIVRALGYGR